MQVRISTWVFKSLSQIVESLKDVVLYEVEFLKKEVEFLKNVNESLENVQHYLENKIMEIRRQETLIQQRQSSSRPSYFSSLTRHTSRPSSSKAFTSTLNPFRLFRASSLNPFRFFRTSILGRFCPASTSAARRLFVCGICLEEMPSDSVARPDPCGHAFCRECLREHVFARLDERRFPIPCPTCTANKGKGKGVDGGTCRGRMVNSLIIISHYVSLRGLAVPCPKPRTHRRTKQYLD